MKQEPTNAQTLNRAKPYQLVLFPLNNGATNVYYVLILTYIATFGNVVLGLAMVFASFMVTGMRVFDAITDIYPGRGYGFSEFVCIALTRQISFLTQYCEDELE